jgi:predicted PurR-regulated permease PerM
MLFGSARPLAGRISVRVLPSERLLSRAPKAEDGGTPPIAIRRTDIIAFALVGLLVITIIAVLFVAKAFLLPVVLAFVIGTMLSPAANLLEHYRLPRSVAAVLIVTTLGSAIAFLVGLIASPLLDWSNRLPELAARLKDKLHVFDYPLALWQQMQHLVGGTDILSGWQMPNFDWMRPTIEFLSPTFTEFLLFFATLILFVASWRDLRRALILTFRDHRARLQTLRILNAIETQLGHYLLTVTLINTGVGIATSLVCMMTGMPSPAGLGVLAGALNFIPIIGPIVTFAVLTMVGIVSFPALGEGLLASLAFAGIAFLEGHFITPTIIGRRLALNALAVFLALAFWTWLWGPLGAFLASPLLIVALILKEHLVQDNSPQLPGD